jgi:hypothetical protein
MNISEFERHKPRLTYKKIQGVIYKYERLKNQCDPVSNKDKFDVFSKVLEDLESIQQTFISGE